MGLTQHHQSNTIHELSGTGDHLKTKMFNMFSFEHTNLVNVLLFCFNIVCLFYFNFLFHILVLLTLIINGAEYQSGIHIHFREFRNYMPKIVTYTEEKTGDAFSCTKGVFLFEFFLKSDSIEV